MAANRRFWVRGALTGEVQHLAPGCDIWTLVKGCPTQAGGLSLYRATHAPGTGPFERLMQHAEDEIIVPLAGELAFFDEHRSERLGPGSLLHVPSWGLHRLPCVGEIPADFFVLKLLGPEGKDPNAEMEPAIIPFDAEPLGPGTAMRQWGESRRRLLASGARLQFGKFLLEGGHGYPIHSHPHDLILILLGGRLRGIGHDTQAPAVIFYPAGCPHAVSPVPEGAEFIAIELHGPA